MKKASETCPSDLVEERFILCEPVRLSLDGRANVFSRIALRPLRPLREYSLILVRVHTTYEMTYVLD